MNIVRVGFLVILQERNPEAAREAGEALRTYFGQPPFQTTLYAETEPSRKLISGALKRWTDESLCDIVFIVGANSIAQSDCAGDATKKMLDRELFGLSLAILNCLLKIDPYSALLECRAGARGEALLVNLPGDKKLALAVSEELAHLFARAVSELNQSEL
jgi:molybdopterin biosynthesis enzyme MoaB